MAHRISSELANRLTACRVSLPVPCVSRLRHAPPPSPLTALLIDPARTVAHAQLHVCERRLPVMRAHFPNHPVLPAVEVLNAMFTLSDVLLARPASVLSLTTARFHKPVRGAGTTVNIAVFGEERAEHAADKRTFRGMAWSGARRDSDCMIASATFIVS